MILDGMHWLGLDYDEGPYLPDAAHGPLQGRCSTQMLAAGTAYPCYMTSAELDALREAQMRRASEKPRYDGTLAPRAAARRCRRCPKACSRCCASATRPSGDVTLGRQGQGPRSRSATTRLDDLVIARPDGTPTYNFCVVVDDIDMAHHARDPRRRPRQQHAAADQHLPRARQGAAGVSRHVPMMLNEHGREADQAQRRRKPVTQYRDEGLPARSDGQLPRAPGLEPRRRRDLHARAVRGVVRPRPPGQERRAVRRGQAALGQRAAPEGQADDASSRRWSLRSLQQARHRAPTSACPRSARCSRTAATRRSRWPTGPRRSMPTCSPARPIARSTSTDAVRPAIATLADKLARRRVGQGVDRRRHQGSAGRARPEDARAGDAGARAGDGHGADAVARCRARAVLS